MLKKNDTIALVGCSDTIKIYDEINKLYYILRENGLNPIKSPLLFDKNSTPHDKAEFLNECYNNPDIKAIFDVSGGDLSNEILDYINYDLIKNHPKPFFGYSDLTTVINSITKYGCSPTYLYQVKNIIYKNRESFMKFLFEDDNHLLSFEYDFLRGNYMDGKLVGGNTRCFLKLAGTKYFPVTDGKILFLESRSGSENRIRSYFAQLRQIGVFDKISGLILGTFTELEKDCQIDKIMNIVNMNVADTIPVIKTSQIGHSIDSKMLKIGEYYRIG